MGEIGDDATMQARWATVAAVARTMAAAPVATIRPPTLSAPAPGGAGTQTTRAAPRDVPAMARVLARVPTGSDEARVEVHEVFAQGGMGVLRRAKQRAMGREVALKSVRPDRADDSATQTLLDEAWITGRLEHPNIVPVYDVELVAGQPHVLMQRIEGQPWSELMGDAETVARRFGEPDLVAWNVQTLMQVAAAVHYAHSRQVVHLDIKPENVMVGGFGQVYLLDWGIAVLLEAADDSLALPRASQRRGVAGTPAYMAPEMVDDQPHVDERTDVYLLGATLFHVIAGRPPHASDSALSTLHNALFVDPEAPEGVPTELKAIAAKAMARDRSQRFASAEAFRLALADFLRHRGSVRIADDAQRELEALQAAAKGSTSSTDDDADRSVAERRAALQAQYAAARFGFSQALAIWPDNEAAKAGLESTLITMAHAQLDLGEVESATTLAAELDVMPVQLQARLREAQGALDEERQRMNQLAQLGREFDMTSGQRTRWFLTIVFGTFSVIGPLISDRYDSHGVAHSHAIYLAVTAAFLVILGGLGVWARDSMTKSKINLRYGLGLLLILPVQMVIIGITWYTGQPPEAGIPSFVLTWFMTAALMGVLLDARIWPTAVAYLIAYVRISVTHERQFLVIALADLVMTLNVTWMWWPERVFERRRPRP